MASLTSLQLTHMPHDNHSVWKRASSGSQKETKMYYSAHNFATRVSFGTYESVHDGKLGNVVRIFMDLSQELYCQQSLSLPPLR